MYKLNNFSRIAAAVLVSFALGSFITYRALEERITLAVLQEAQKVVGIEFSAAELDSMLVGVQQQAADFEANRKVTLNNATAPALIFNPFPQGFVFPTEYKPFEAGSLAQPVKLPANEQDLAYYSVRQLSELIRTQQISSEKLTQFFIERLKKYNPQLFCVITLMEEKALAQARQADAEIKAGKYRGWLHGIPFGAKDLLAAQGHPTTWGSPIYQQQQIDEDATVIRKLTAAGAVLVAKLSVGELAWGDVWFGGTTRNPWMPAQGSSGSSAGSASAVSAGLLPFAIGTETLGSIVSPSTVCGVTGLRPTFGRVSRAGAMALSWSMDKIGPICRTVEDCALVFQAIVGKDGLDLSVVDAPFNYNATQDARKLRVGYLKNDFEGVYPFKTTDEATLQKMRDLGFELVPISLPDLPVRSISFILWAEAAAAFDELTLTNQDDQMVRQIKNAWPNFFRRARFVPAVEYIKANRLRTLLMEAMQQTLQNVDVYLAPSWIGTNLTLTNLTGHPCVVLPNGFSAQGTPQSITFVGKLLGEAELLLVAKTYQEATDVHLQHPEWVKQ